MTCTIDNRIIEILDAPDYEQMTPTQADTCRFLLSLGEGKHSFGTVLQGLKWRSALPFWSRLQHLEEKGFLRVKTTEVAAV